MTVPQFNMRQLLEAGVHFGHQSHRWNPKMAPFIYGARNNIHILDLTQTVPMLHQALNKVSDTVAGGGRALGLRLGRAGGLQGILHRRPLRRRGAFPRRMGSS